MDDTSNKLSYAAAINQALHELMSSDESVIVIGQGATSPWYVGTTTINLLEEFGPERIIDTPISENAVTGAAMGAALTGMRPIVVHPRMDFMLYALDPIINQAANWNYMFGGRAPVPLVVWGIINRGGEQAAQHSQALHATFAHIPGLKVVLPSNPRDAKGLLIAATRDNNPVIFVDDRWLYPQEQEVPSGLWEVPIGKGAVCKTGTDLTVVATSYCVRLAMQAAEILEGEDISIEVIDLRSLKPLDTELLFTSANKTGQVVVIDGGWRSYGVSGELAALITENCWSHLQNPVIRVTLPDLPAPANPQLEKAYYPTHGSIVDAVRNVIKR